MLELRDSDSWFPCCYLCYCYLSKLDETKLTSSKHQRLIIVHAQTCGRFCLKQRLSGQQRRLRFPPSHALRSYRRFLENPQFHNDARTHFDPEHLEALKDHPPLEEVQHHHHHYGAPVQGNDPELEHSLREW